MRPLIWWLLAAASSMSVAAQAPAVSIQVEVRSEAGAVEGARVIVAGRESVTDAQGLASVASPPGPAQLTVVKDGFLPTTVDLTVADAGLRVVVELTAPPDVDEEVIVVATTRTGRRLDDQPTRVEVLGREEIEEKMLMTPGDIVMMLNEMGGLRVQATSPSIGAASVRVQGMKGRYTRFLSDGLPLYGQQVGGLGLLQIPPMDLGQVEVIKGTASALYGAGAMGGVVNLLSRRPGPEMAGDALLNVSTLGGGDAVGFVAGPLGTRWSASLLASGHGQAQNDRDDDDWADVAGFARAVVRPRLFWDGGNGRSGFVTAGMSLEDREGGTMDGGVLAATGQPYTEALDTRRFDVGGSVQTLLRNRYVLTARAAAAWQRHDHRFGDVRERDQHDTVFGEAAIRGAAGRHTWIAGAAYERDAYDPQDVARFRYAYDVPGVFAQDDVDLASWLSLSAGARVDFHDEYGTFFSPRVAAMVRAGGWVSRIAVGRGFFAPTPLTEETEAAGLTRLAIVRPLVAEEGTSASADVTRAVGPASITATVFGSWIAHPVAVDRDEAYVLFNRADATANAGAELLATVRSGSLVGTATYTYVRSREQEAGGPVDAALTPRHSAGLVGMWESEDVGRIGLEVYYTGEQRLDVNPYRSVSRPYVLVGLLGERRFGRWRLFVNAENLTDVRQTRWDSLLRPSRGADGRWTVDAWAPLDGRAINGGIRVGF